jgi:hypothetical protein
MMKKKKMFPGKIDFSSFKKRSLIVRPLKILNKPTKHLEIKKLVI